MTNSTPGRPATDEFADWYAGYIGLVPDGDVRDHLRRQANETISLLSGVTDTRASRGYAPGKWSLKELVCHVGDGERVFAYRLLRIARGDATPLPGFEQDDWVPQSGANARSMEGLLLELSTVRGATVQLADSLSPDAWMRRGTASGNPLSARAIAYIIAGHELHHRQIVREKYLP